MYFKISYSFVTIFTNEMYSFLRKMMMMWTDIEIIFALLKAEHLTVYKCTFFIKGLRGDQGGNGFCGVSTQPCFPLLILFLFFDSFGDSAIA